MTVTALGLEITDRCNLSCAHCLRSVVPPHAPTGLDLDVGLARRLIAEAATLGLTTMAVSGGEPLVHPRFLEIVDAAVDAGLRYHFVTNGLLLPAFLADWAQRPQRRARLRDICVSLDGATEVTHDAIRGRGTFRRTLAGIALLRAMQVPFALVCCVNRINRHEIDALGLFAHHLGALRLLFAHKLPTGAIDPAIDLEFGERLAVEDTIKRLMHALRFEIVMGAGYLADRPDTCPALQQALINVDPGGRVMFCCELSNHRGDRRAPRERRDFICDLNEVSLSEALELQAAAVAALRAAWAGYEARGAVDREDRFPCHFCLRHFGKIAGQDPV